MGVIWSKFRGSPSPKELLEKITKDLDDIYDRRVYSQLQHKRIIGTLIVISVIIYLILAIVFYVCYFPSELIWQIVYCIPFIVFPVIIWALKLALQWYFKYTLSQNEDKVTLLLRKRKKLLDEVKEKETYKVAKELLEKYDPEQMEIKAARSMLTTPSCSLDNLSKLPDMELRRRASFGSKRLPSQQSKLGNFQTSKSVNRPSAIIKPGYNAPPGTVTKPTYTPVQSRPPGVPMPCPILPRQRGGFDRLVEYVLSDGPGNRYALICRQCQSHNGMSLKEEYEYTSYRCCYCYTFNPAKKQKPLAPRLLLPRGKTLDEGEVKETQDKTSDSQRDSKTDDDKADVEIKENVADTSSVNKNLTSELEEAKENISETESLPENGDKTLLTEYTNTCTDESQQHLESMEELPEPPEFNDSFSQVEDSNAEVSS